MTFSLRSYAMNLKAGSWDTPMPAARQVEPLERTLIVRPPMGDASPAASPRPSQGSLLARAIHPLAGRGPAG